MYCPGLKEFLKLSKKANVVPVYKDVSADLDTPVSTFLKIKKNDYAFLLESVEGQEKIARYSLMGSNPNLIFRSKANNIELIYADRKKRGSAPVKNRERFIGRTDPLSELRKVMNYFKPAVVNGLPRFFGGFVGYVSYDMVRFFEKLPDKNRDDLKLPDAIFILTNNILVFDHMKHKIKIIDNVIIPGNHKKYSKNALRRLYNQAVRDIENVHKELKKPLSNSKEDTKKSLKAIKISSNFKKKKFMEIVRKAKDYIRKGDIIQVVLSQRLKAKIQRKPFDIYRKLRSLNPSPYMFYLKLKEVTLIGSSPEMLVRCEGGIVQTRPIAGTRPRGKTEKEDQRLEAELCKDKKEAAEHIMLVDLGRNDLGRISKPGKVRVSEFMKVEKYSHVMHLVSEVTGVLNKKYDSFDVLRACFPAGTVSGSPKIRAMEIIEELENIKRNLYAGCVGYFSFSKNMDTCITIRTIVIQGNRAYIQAGAGIVADSKPEKEYYESMSKASALLESL
ncbi:MAG: anthranilate synthase component I [Candidatus Omnitrophota bacterium]|nr:MAG: anthranilate synthase component I [Candidatus Omnitrophota bacterium]